MNHKLLYKNCLVDNIYEACTCCYDNTKELDYMQKKEYLEKRINAGHESILEHGRLALMITNIHDTTNIADVMGYEYSKWLEFYTTQLEDESYNMIVNGSIRAYKHFINHITEDTYEFNPIVKSIVSILLENTPKELWGNMFKIKDFLSTHNFIDVEPDETYIDVKKAGIVYDNIFIRDIPDIQLNKKDATKSVIIGCDSIKYYDLLIDDIMSNGFVPDIAENIFVTTIVFLNMSRTATHQLVRHRNAITQESQRYVNASDASFTIPVPNCNKTFNITLFGNTVNTSLSKLATELINIYGQLFSQGLKKEEARGFLPSNVNCGRLYMTFTLSSLDAFIKLRTNPHAQYEIRKYAETIKDVFDNLTTDE